MTDTAQTPADTTPPSHIDIVGQAHFDETIAREDLADVIVLVDFWADWCGPCRMLKPVLETLAETNDDVMLLAINVDEPDNAPLAGAHNVSGIPHVAIYRNGEKVDEFVGALPPAEIDKKITALRG